MVRPLNTIIFLKLDVKSRFLRGSAPQFIKTRYKIPIIGGRIHRQAQNKSFRQAQNKFEPRLKSGGISLTLNLRPTDS